MPPTIQELPKNLVDQIKAGEVLERPGYLLKELIENSIDAKATEISLTIHDNGMKFCSIKDNGQGITPADMPLAFKRHTTSKIKNFDDLYNIYSYGFRGEALASIASVCQLTCESKTLDSPAHKVEITGGELTLSTTTTSDQVGTEIFIKDLFYNTPARLKFLSSTQAEKNFIKRILLGFILSKPNIAFKIRLDDEEVKSFASTKDQSERIAQAFKVFERLDDEVELQEAEYDGLSIKIFKTKKQTSRQFSQNKNFIFINDRLVQNTQLHSILAQFLINEDHEYPKYVLCIKTPPGYIDVNVHPNKTFVKFFEISKVIALMKGILAKPKEHSVSSKNNNSMAQGVSQEKAKSNFHPYFDSFFTELPNTDYILINQENTSYMLSKSRYLLSKLFLTSPHVSVPLLISEPIDGQLTQEQTQFLETLGYELDQLDTQTMALRSFPKILSDFPYLKILKTILKEFERNKVIELSSLLKKKMKWSCDIRGILFNQEEIQNEMDWLIENKVLKPVPEDLWDQIFYE